MAFYHDAPGQRKPDRRKQDNWEDEGSRYGGERRKGDGEHRERSVSAGGRPMDRRGLSSRYTSHDGDENRERRGRACPPRERREEHSGRGPGRPSYPRREAKPVQAAPKSYRDFEHTAEPVEEYRTNLPNENLLAGRNPIREAIRGGRDIEKLLVVKGELSGSAKQIVQMAKEAHIPVQEVDKSRLDEITPHHQGMLAFASAYSYSTVEDMLAAAKERGEEPFLVILDGVTDPQNLGAVIRSAECVGAHGVIVRERRSVGLTPAAVKASAGAIEHMKVARVNNLNRLLAELKQQGIWTYAVTMDGEDYQRVNFRGGVALVIGGEGEGISRLTLESCDHRVSLPMVGHIDSLNASVAAGVMMYRVLAFRTNR